MVQTSSFFNSRDSSGEIAEEVSGIHSLRERVCTRNEQSQGLHIYKWRL
jgi:hypothetical protein